MTKPDSSLKNKLELDVLYQSSDFYAPVTGTSLTSLLESNKHLDRIRVFLLNDGIAPANLDLFQKLCAQYNRDLILIDALQISELLASLKVPMWRGSYTTYCKLFVEKHLPADVDHLLYLDSDMIINGALDELITIDLSVSPCAMAIDCILLDYKELISYKKDAPYYNGGMVLFNMEYWRRENCGEAVAAFLQDKNSVFFAADMDIINILYSEKIIPLDLKFNVTAGFFLYDVALLYKIYGLNEKVFYPLPVAQEAKKNPVIYHFTGGGAGGRPWEEGNTMPNSTVWERYNAISPWRTWPRLCVNMPAYLKAQSLAYRLLPAPLYAILHRKALQLFFIRKLRSASSRKKS